MSSISLFRNIRNSVAIRLIAQILLFIILPFAVIIALLFTTVKRDSDSRQRELVGSLFNQIDSNISRNIEFTREISHNILSNGELIRFLSAPYSAGDDYRQYMTVVRGYINAIISADYRSDIRIYIVNETIPMGAEVFYLLSEVSDEPAISAFINSDYISTWHSQQDFREEIHNPYMLPVQERFIYFEKMYSPSLEFLGIIAFSIPESYFFRAGDMHGSGVSTFGDARLMNMTDVVFDNNDLAIICTEGTEHFQYKGINIYSRVPDGFPFRVIIAVPVDMSFTVISIVTACISLLILFSVYAFIRLSVNKELARKEDRLVALQHQINPHFIYNTLEVFSSKMKLYGHYAESDALVSFAGIFRYNINTADSMVTLNEEIKQARNYVQIRNLSYPNVTLETLIGDNLLDVMIPKFIFQPIIENSITHGTKAASDALAIQISAQLSGDKVYFTVTDNGCGPDDNGLDRLNNLLAAPAAGTAKSPGRSIGLGNINTRLRLLYGDDAHITVSRKNGLTVISFYIIYGAAAT